MANAYFAALDAGPGGSRYRAMPATTGPWNPELQHGGPPSALLVRTAERLAAAETGRSDLVAMRFAGEFVGPVPVAEIHVTARLVRTARSGVLVACSLSGRDRICLEARVWLIRDADTSDIASAHLETAVVDPGRGLGGSFPYADSVEWRSERGSLAEPGPASMWARARIPVVAGDLPSGLQRAVLVGDSASGISAELDWTDWSFLNVDLDVHLARPVHGDWLRMEASTQLGTHGAALAQSRLSDMDGPVGVTAQTLVLAPRAMSTANVG